MSTIEKVVVEQPELSQRAFFRGARLPQILRSLSRAGPAFARLGNVAAQEVEHSILVMQALTGPGVEGIYVTGDWLVGGRDDAGGVVARDFKTRYITKADGWSAVGYSVMCESASTQLRGNWLEAS